MSYDEKLKALLDAYIEACLYAGNSLTSIMDALTVIFDRPELEAMGYGDFIRPYFEPYFGMDGVQ